MVVFKLSVTWQWFSGKSTNLCQTFCWNTFLNLKRNCHFYAVFQQVIYGHSFSCQHWDTLAVSEMSEMITPAVFLQSCKGKVLLRLHRLKLKSSSPPLSHISACECLERNLPSRHFHSPTIYCMLYNTSSAMGKGGRAYFMTLLSDGWDICRLRLSYFSRL